MIKSIYDIHPQTMDDLELLNLIGDNKESDRLEALFELDLAKIDFEDDEDSYEHALRSCASLMRLGLYMDAPEIARLYFEDFMNGSFFNGRDITRKTLFSELADSLAHEIGYVNNDLIEVVNTKGGSSVAAYLAMKIKDDSLVKKLFELDYISWKSEADDLNNFSLDHYDILIAAGDSANLAGLKNEASHCYNQANTIFNFLKRKK